MTEHTDQDIINLHTELNNAIATRQWSTIRQRTLPMIARPVVLGASLFAGLAGLWEHLEPMAQKFGVMGAAGALAAGTAASLIAPLFNKESSPIVTPKDAVRMIDQDINHVSKPTQTLRGKIARHSASGAEQMWNLELKRIWKEWSGPITNQKKELGHSPYYTQNTARTVLHSGAIAAAVSAALLTNVDIDDFKQAWQYETPPPPLEYSAWVTPPEGVSVAPLYQDSMLQNALEEGQNDSLPVHEGSVFSIITHDRAGEITVNGDAINYEGFNEEDNTNNPRAEAEEFSYSIPLDAGNVNISIEGDNFTFVVTPDENPSIDILSVQPDAESPNNLVIEYIIEDDYGASSADVTIVIKDDDGNIIKPLVPSLEIPPIPIPHSDRPDGP
ncbi:MAG: DUF4175 family protein [Alphaproteobacteria bacterium]